VVLTKLYTDCQTFAEREIHYCWKNPITSRPGEGTARMESCGHAILKVNRGTIASAGA
jgi:hypothetical protein